MKPKRPEDEGCTPETATKIVALLTAEMGNDHLMRQLRGNKIHSEVVNAPRSYGSPKLGKVGYFAPKLTPEVKEKLLGLINKLSVNEIQATMLADLGIHISTTTIYNLRKKHQTCG